MLLGRRAGGGAAAGALGAGSGRNSGEEGERSERRQRGANTHGTPPRQGENVTSLHKNSNTTMLSSES